MAMAEDLTPLEILGVAIKSEIAAARLYEYMAEQVANLDLKERLQFLVKEEQKHRRILEQAYHRQFPEIALVLPEQSLVPTVEAALQQGTPIPELFRLAMESERLSKEFYGDLAGRATEENSRSTLQYLSQMEQGHYDLLKTEYELIQRFPSYYQVEDFHLGEEMVHFGP
ncbi:MAG: ferritin family protein [Chloroflexia bacterium]|nr:ferritin family protein [Chloroflexia bacterium]